MILVKHYYTFMLPEQHDGKIMDITQKYGLKYFPLMIAKLDRTCD